MPSTTIAPTMQSDSAHGAPWQIQPNQLLDSTGEGSFGIDMDGRCVFINRAGADMLGWQAAAVLGQNMHALTHHSHADGSAYSDSDCPIFNAFRQGLPCRVETEVFWRRDQTCFAVEYSSHPILDGPQVRGAVITFVDITARRQAAQALQQANASLAQANDKLELRVGERTRELSAALERLRKLAAYSESIIEEERTRIAREVHDELGSLLVALKMDVNWMDKRLSEQQQRTAPEAEAVRTRLRCKCQNMSRLIENAVDNGGRIITDLRPSILDHQGLWAALEWQTGEFVAAAELALDWGMEIAGQAELPEPAAMAVFRIFQEMLSNVGRHARASSVRVRICADLQRLRVTVQDDGCGAPPEAFEAATAYGVMGMRERARQFGGHLTILSTPGAGSTFSLEMPMQESRS